MIRRLELAVAALGALVACHDRRTDGPIAPPAIAAPTSAAPPSSPAAPVTIAPPAPVAPIPTTPALAPAPRTDLAANRVRWHIYDRGLVIPVGGAGLAKYVLAYRSPWSPIRELQGRAGRRLRGDGELIVPWDGGAMTVWVRAHGRGKVRVRIDGKSIGAAELGGDWREVAIAGPVVAAGEHTLRVDVPADAIVHDLELAAPDAAPCGDAWPSLTAAPDGALGGAHRLALLTEVPDEGWLVARPSGGATGTISAVDETGARTALWQGPMTGAEVAIDLRALAGHVIRLELASDACTASWPGAALAVAARPAVSLPPPFANAILIVVDTLRADRVRAVGPAQVDTPRMTAAAAAHGVAFAAHQAMAPSSPPSHATIHTSMIPRVHGIAGDTGTLAPDAPILSAVVTAAGLEASYVGDNEFAMEHFRKGGRWRAYHVPTQEGQGLDCAPLVARVLQMVDASVARGKRFFVSALPIEPHEPYRYHAGVTEKYYQGPFDKPIGKELAALDQVPHWHLSARQWQQLRGLYDGEVEHWDQCYGVLEDGLAARGLADSTAIVITSDHGEGLGEHGGRVGHAYSLHQELIAVPLIILGKGVPAMTIAVPTSAIDVAPTVLALLGVAADPRMQGRSFLPLVALGAAAPPVVASEYGKSYALRTRRWHYVVDYDGREALYDVTVDPREDHDQVRAQPLVLRYLRDAAGLYLAHRTAWRAATWGALDDIAPTAPLAAD
jgi:arylsulfatase A-like enzyme